MLYCDERPPFHLAAQRQQLILQAPGRSAGCLNFGIAQETDQQFHRAVARPAAQPGHRGVDPVRPVDDRLDRVGEGQLLVVVGVDAHLLAGRLAVLRDTSSPATRPARRTASRSCRRPRACWPAFRAITSSTWSISVSVDGRDGHQVGRHLVALVGGVLDHVDRLGHLVGVEGHADHVQHAVLLRQDVGPPVATCRRRPSPQSFSGVGLSPTMRRRSSSSQNFQSAELVAGEELLRRLVADLHVVDARPRRRPRRPP